MHYLYFVLLAKQDLMNSEQACQMAAQELENICFAGEGGVFSSPKADWYVIGGRWSGCLSRLKGKEPKPDLEHIAAEREQFNKFRKDPETVWHPSKMSKAEFDKTVEEHMKSGGTRSSYRNEGYSDDAMRLTPILRKLLQKKYGEDGSETGGYGDGIDVFHVQEGDEISLADLKETHDGRWIVVVDYHN